MTSGGGEGRTNWESVTLIRIYLNITWTQQGLRIGYFDFSQVHSRRYFSKFSRYTAGDIFRIFPGTQQAIFLKILFLKNIVFFLIYIYTYIHILKS